MNSVATKASDEVSPGALAFLGVAFLAAVWLQLFGALTPTWAAGTYYNYGWIVPLLVAITFYRQWQDADDGTALPAPARPKLRRFVAGAAALLLVVTALRILELSDPGWSVPLWGHALAVTAFSIFLLVELLGPARAGGFLFIGVLALTAVPLPSMIEIGLVDKLTGLVLETAAVVISLLGESAEIRGSFLLVDGQALEVDEACSGIRSFQSLFMYAVFFGEFWRLPLLGRFSLLLLGLVAAILTNVARVVVLTKIFVERGQAAFDAAHDWVGYIAFAVAVAGLLLGAKFLEARDRDLDVARPPEED